MLIYFKHIASLKDGNNDTFELVYDQMTRVAVYAIQRIFAGTFLCMFGRYFRHCAVNDVDLRSRHTNDCVIWCDRWAVFAHKNRKKQTIVGWEVMTLRTSQNGRVKGYFLLKLIYYNWRAFCAIFYVLKKNVQMTCNLAWDAPEGAQKLLHQKTVSLKLS